MLRIVGPISRGGGVAPPPLHAPDGFFSMPVLALGWVISAAAVAVAVQMTGRRLNERLVPAMGVFAAFIFAAQMLNFPVAGGTSGHLVGGALVAIVLGPWAAVLVMTAVVALQALLFQDGGLVALGVNVLNMAVISTFVGWGVYVVGRRLAAAPAGLLGVGFAAAWVSVVVAALAAAAELSLSGTSPFTVTFPAMGGVHALIGIGEGLITAAALGVVRAGRRDLLELSSAAADGGGR